MYAHACSSLSNCISASSLRGIGLSAREASIVAIDNRANEIRCRDLRMLLYHIIVLFSKR